MSEVAAPRAQRAWGLMLFGIASGSVLIPLNSTMLAVALPRIMAEFGVSAGAVAWLVAGYLATVALATPASGSLGDRFGHRRVFLAGVGAFALTSLAAATARSFPVLVASRILQGATGALISPNSASLVRAMAPEDRRGASFGLFDMIVSTSAAVGPFLGGVLAGGYGWRALFVVVVPGAMLSAALVASAVPADGRDGDRRPPLDLPGLALLMLALLGLLQALSALRSGGAWALWLAGALALLAAFAWQELRVPLPAVDVRLFRDRPFAAAVIGVLGATVVLHGNFILIPILTQSVMGASPTESGTVLLGLSALSAVAAPFGGRLSDRIGRRSPAVAGSVCMALGLAGLWLWTAGLSLWGVGALLAVVGIGFGLSGSPRQTSALESVPAGSSGMAAGAYFTSRYVGGALGASLAGVILASGVQAGAASSGFGVLALVAAGVAVASLGLRGAPDPSARR